MPANGCAAARQGRPPRRTGGPVCIGLTSSPRVFQPEPQNVGLDGADRHGHAIVGELSVLRLVGDAALEDFPFYEDARRRTTPALPRAPILWRRISGRASKVSAHRFVRRAGYRLSRKRKAPRRQVTGVIFVEENGEGPGVRLGRLDSDRDSVARLRGDGSGCDAFKLSNSRENLGVGRHRKNRISRRGDCIVCFRYLHGDISGKRKFNFKP